MRILRDFVNTARCGVNVVLLVTLAAAVTATGHCEISPDLVKAVWSGDVSSLRQLIARGVDVNQKAKDGMSALMYAVASEHKEVVEVLLAEGADVNFQSETGSSPLRCAAFIGNEDIVKSLLAKGARTDTKDCWGYSPAIAAAMGGKQEILKLLQNAGAPFTNDLVYAASLGQLDYVQQQLIKKVDANMTNGTGWTALAAAAANGHSSVVKLLLSKGADPNSRGWDRDFSLCALRLAAANGRSDVVKVLLENKADVNALIMHRTGRTTGETPLMGGITSGNAEVVSLLLKGRANPNERLPSGRPALWRATEKPTVLKVLLENGADVNIQDKDGTSALMAAAYYGNVEAVFMLLDKGARSGLKNEQGQTALQLAIAFRSQEEAIEKQRARDMIIELLSDPAEAKKNFSSFQAVNQGGVPTVKVLTKVEWKKKYSTQFGFNNPMVTAAVFKRVFGEPSRSQTAGADAYWYYRCTDGTIQVVLNNPDIMGDNGACIKLVNDN